MNNNIDLKEFSRGFKTKKMILECSLALFSSNGFKATTVRDISNSVGVKQSALYNHFKNKNEILETLIEDLTTSAIANIFTTKDGLSERLYGKSILLSISTTFKLISFDKKNEALFKLLIQELYNNERVREIYNEYFYQTNVKKLSSILFDMMQNDIIKSNDPLILANEFFSPLFFYQMQISLLKQDKKSTSAIVSLFEKHVDFFWDNIKVEQRTTLL